MAIIPINSKQQTLANIIRIDSKSTSYWYDRVKRINIHCLATVSQTFLCGIRIIPEFVAGPRIPTLLILYYKKMYFWAYDAKKGKKAMITMYKCYTVGIDQGQVLIIINKISLLVNLEKVWIMLLYFFQTWSN